MLKVLPVAVAIAALVVICAEPVAAQRAVRLQVTLPPERVLATAGPAVAGVGLLDGAELRELITSGFPARLRYRVELWPERGWFKRPYQETEWDVYVEYEPLGRVYRVARIVGESVTDLGTFRDFEGVRAAAARPFNAPIQVPREHAGERVYYRATLEITRMSMSDLDELRRWMNGELRPAIRGERNPGTALARGLETLFVRLLGVQKRQYEARSPSFTAE
jgi:hypothetical protein